MNDVTAGAQRAQHPKVDQAALFQSPAGAIRINILFCRKPESQKLKNRLGSVLRVLQHVFVARNSTLT